MSMKSLVFRGWSFLCVAGSSIYVEFTIYYGTSEWTTHSTISRLLYTNVAASIISRQAPPSAGRLVLGIMQHCIAHGPGQRFLIDHVRLSNPFMLGIGYSLNIGALVIGTIGPLVFIHAFAGIRRRIYSIPIRNCSRRRARLRSATLNSIGVGVCV